MSVHLRARSGAWWLRLAPLFLAELPVTALLLLLMLTGAALVALAPWPLKLIVDHVLAKRPLPESVGWLATLPGAERAPGLLGWLAAATVLVFAASVLVRIAQNYVQAGIGTRMVYGLGAALFDHLQRLSLSFHDRRPAGDLVRRVLTDSECIKKLTMGCILPIVSSLATLALMFVVMWRLSPVLSLVALLFAPLLALVIKLFAHPMTERTYEQHQLEGEMLALAEQTLTALPVIQAFGREDHGDRRYRALSERTFRAAMRAALVGLQFKLGVHTVTALGTATLMVLGGLQVHAGSLSVGDLLVFLAYLASLYVPLESLAYAGSGYAAAAAGARRVLELLDVEQEVRDAPGASPLSEKRAGSVVRIEQVTFGYEPGRAVLRGVSLEALPGQSVALVGATGAGKSTLVSLIPRFFDPWQGRVTIDGRDVRQIQLASLRAHVALVPQEPFLLPLSVRDNIAYGRPGATRAEIEAAAEVANAEGFIRELPAGYETVLGERGATLSAGQRQRLSIARALLKDAPVLILDEPTSALDAGTETLLMEALTRLMRGRTTFLIAHRLSTIRRADLIVVLEGGVIVESGTHAELLARGGVYRRFHGPAPGRAALRAAREEAR